VQHVLDLVGGAVEVRQQRVAGVAEQALQALHVVADDHQVVLQVGSGHQWQARAFR
jgi:hypothetical protein